VSAYVEPVKEWKEFWELWLDAQKSDFQIIAIDSLTMLWRLWYDYFITTNGIKHESDIKFTGYDKFYGGFANTMIRLQDTQKGLVIVAHEEQRDINDAVKMWPWMPRTKNIDKVSGAITQITDMNLYMKYGKQLVGGKMVNSRVIKCVGTDEYLAGSRWNLPDEIQLIEGNPTKSAQALIDAYNAAVKIQTIGGK
jgi:hypothetical protein